MRHILSGSRDFYKSSVNTLLRVRCGGKTTAFAFFFPPAPPCFSAGHPDYGVKRPPTFLARSGRPPAFGEKPRLFDYSAATSPASVPCRWFRLAPVGGIFRHWPILAACDTQRLARRPATGTAVMPSARGALAAFGVVLVCASPPIAKLRPWQAKKCSRTFCAGASGAKRTALTFSGGSGPRCRNGRRRPFRPAILCSFPPPCGPLPRSGR